MFSNDFSGRALPYLSREPYNVLSTYLSKSCRIERPRWLLPPGTTAAGVPDLADCWVLKLFSLCIAVVSVLMFFDSPWIWISSLPVAWIGALVVLCAIFPVDDYPVYVCCIWRRRCSSCCTCLESSTACNLNVCSVVAIILCYNSIYTCILAICLASFSRFLRTSSSQGMFCCSFNSSCCINVNPLPLDSTYTFWRTISINIRSGWSMTVVTSQPYV